MAFYPLQTQSFSLNGSGAVAGATSLTLKSMLDIDGNTISMSDLGAIAYMTLEPGNGDLEEQISFTGITQNASGTATLTGIKSVTFGTPYTSTSGLAKTHAGSTTAVLSNTSGYYTQFAVKANDETITGQWGGPTPLNADSFTTKTYVDNLVNGGTVSINQIVIAGSAGETVSAGQILYFKAADGLWYKASSAASATTDNIQLGVAQGSGTTGNPISGGILLEGIDTNQSGLTQGTIYYLSTGGAISSSAGTVERAIGQAASTTTLLFNPNYYYIPTADIKAAQTPGGDYGSPSSSNPFITYVYAATNIPTIGTYIVSGSPYTWNKPSGLKYIHVKVIGAGGGGGSITNAGIAGAGGGGGYSEKFIAVADLGSTETITVGAGGAGGATPGANNGATGGTSSFGSHASATGGAGGTAQANGAGGAGGAGSNGDFNLTGQAGSSGGPDPATSSAAAAYAKGGLGGNSPLGWGYGGKNKTTDATAQAGGVYGGGGAGAASEGGTDSAGGDGGNGFVVVTHYYT